MFGKTFVNKKILIYGLGLSGNSCLKYLYKKNYISIAICIHGDSVMSGHGPGIMTIMTGKKNDLGWKINKKANIKNLLKIKI